MSLVLLAILPSLVLAAEPLSVVQSPAVSSKDGVLRCVLDARSGLPIQLHSVKAKRSWLTAPVSVRVRNEVSGKEAGLACRAVRQSPDAVATDGSLEALGLAASQEWSASPDGLVWDLSFGGTGPRVGHEVTIDWPLLKPGLKLFTPSEHGVVDVSAAPAFRPVPYATSDFSGGRSYVLPLVSVLDPAADSALTIALPAAANIPHLQFEWLSSGTLRMTMAHRGMGGKRPSPLRILLWTHPADYRSALRAYSDRFPAHFNSPMPPTKYEGAFWYHHIHDHPDFGEMARQKVRYIWSSFWFTHLGEYLPAEKEWMPYTYAAWWKLGQTMTDEKIRAFIRRMHDHGIGTYAYFNVTEYGGVGGKSGDTAAAERILREKFANALMKDAAGKPIPTWEGAMAMNAGKDYALWPFLQEQVRRHIQRLPEFDGFIIDRLDWASTFDYGHDDGLTMVGTRPAENMALPVGRAVEEICRMMHADGKRVFVNQFWRVEVLKDTDGVCHESDYLPALGYLTPMRPASAWSHVRDYQGDLLQFEGQLKRRLHWALFPQMIAHEFPISQQGPAPKAADLLEIYAPLFETLRGKKQVLLPHCVSVDGANDVNLFVNGAGHYVAPVTSRVHFLSRGRVCASSATITLRTPDGGDLTWAHVYSPETPPYRTAIARRGDCVLATANRHESVSMLVVGKGSEPALENETVAAKPQTLSRLFGDPSPAASAASRPAIDAAKGMMLRIRGTQLGYPGPVEVRVGGRRAGQISGDSFQTDLPAESQLPGQPPAVVIVSGHEGVWYLPHRIELVAKPHDGKLFRVAEWDPRCGSDGDSARGELRPPLRWCAPEEVALGKVRFVSRDAKLGGQWPGRFGSKAAWIPLVTAAQTLQNGCQLQASDAAAFLWKDKATNDARVPASPPGRGAERQATCWHHQDKMTFEITPPDVKPYRLTVYVFDFDRHGREMRVSVGPSGDASNVQIVSKQDTLAGTYLTWDCAGPQTIEVKKLVGYNAVVSGIFVDPDR